jgi:hypothetical protein
MHKKEEQRAFKNYRLLPPKADHKRVDVWIFAKCFETSAEVAAKKKNRIERMWIVPMAPLQPPSILHEELVTKSTSIF